MILPEQMIIPAPNIALSCPTETQIEDLAHRLMRYPQRETPLTHKFAPGVYLREIFMPAGTFVIGHKHKTEHFNVVLSGRARVLIDGVVSEIVAPCTFASGAGVRKMLYILEDMRWATVHPTTETNVELLESILVEKSGPYIEYQKELSQLREGVI